MPIFICMFSHTRTPFCFFCFYFRRYISVCRVSVSVKYTLLGVLNLCYANNVFENIKTDVKIRIFPIQIAYWSGFGIFKQNRENPNEIRIVGQSGSKTRCCPIQGRWFMNWVLYTGHCTVLSITPNGFLSIITITLIEIKQ